MRRLLLIVLFLLSCTKTITVWPNEKPLDCSIQRFTTVVPEDLKEKTHQKILSLLSIASKHYEREFVPPVVEFVVPIEPTDGGVTYEMGIVVVNPVYLVKYREAFIDEVVTHEIAHYVVYTMYGNRGGGHGHPWQETMKLFGREPKQYHEFKLCE